MQHFRFWHVCLTFLVLSITSLAYGDIELDMHLAKEVRSKQPDGSVLIAAVPATRLQAGDIVTVTIHYKNTSDEMMGNVHIDNPLPADTTYVAGSATGQGASILVSDDGGQTYAIEQPNNASVITHIRWLFETLNGHAEGDVSFSMEIIRSGIKLQ